MPFALHRIQFRWGEGFGLDIEWTKGRGVAAALTGLPVEVAHVETEAEPDTAAICGIPPICYRGDGPMMFEPFQLRENTNYFADIMLPISRAVAEAEIANQPGWPFNARLANVFQVDPPRRWRTDDQGRLIVSGLETIDYRVDPIVARLAFVTASDILSE